MDQAATSANAPKPKRPLGVWLLSIYAVIAAGIMPIVMLVATGQSGLNLSALNYIFTVLLATAIVISAIGTWRGSNRARIYLLVLITAHYVLIAINNAILLFSGNVPGEVHTQLYGRIIRGVLYPAIYIWYFRRSKIRPFYTSKVSERDNSQADPPSEATENSDVVLTPQADR